ncbi:glycoside hydrolase family 3 N-terminal domain-containing protein [Sphingomonas carotinifaciens]|uniref:Beta-D-glucoside glucohydrolase n=1 Tax=Sphingomonas carotinifaciens TaxID=1166323 RepID=A0A1G7P0D9_9SPHN|nr:glycoside hydrolase family 3 N-terminal domain-containing protein [Sphingomonas carotinifaciens]MBB4087255.1 beta-glucosidase [Sphingomonas carotinifaciens]MWC44712.1 beta-glucosidase [Sphingomonas carotinifaciens]SDF79694.1 beta-glucosidase [Sphingomonas carotinifaciens]
MRTFKLATLALAGVASAALGGNAGIVGQASVHAPSAWSNPALAPEQRAQALLRAMTLEEKAGQVSQQFMFGAFDQFAPIVRSGKVGSLLFVTDPAIINRLQKVAVEETRLKIPLIFGYDVIHGFRTIFPVPIGNAASWDPASVERVQGVAAAEARAVGLHWAFSPMLDIARDPRWGRIVEGAGEDPFLGAAMARAQVRGLQGPAIGTPGHVIAGPKHFAGYATAEGGRDYDSVYISDTQLYNVILPPFAAAVQAGAGNIMSAYMDVNDVPAVANHWLLTDVLRGQMGFEGWVVSDANGTKNQVIQNFARDEADAAVRSIAAGNDMEMSFGPAASAETLAASVRAGKLLQATLDRAVLPILTAKFRMGLFEQPFVDEAAAKTILSDPAHRAVAQIAAERALVLLKNDDGALPLVVGANKRVAVIGAMANSKRDTLGPWAFQYDLPETVTVFEGVRDRLGTGATVETAPGVQLKRNVPSMFESITIPGAAKPEPRWDVARAQGEFERALALAKKSDLVILTLGEAEDMSGEGASRADLKLPGEQLKLFDAIAALGKKVVVVTMSGRPLELDQVLDRAPAILHAWYGGTRGGTAVARALFGDVNPGGKLPVTWPRTVGQVPIYYAHNTTHSPKGQAKRYWDIPSTPQFEFGYGLSYTSFTMTDPVVGGGTLAPGATIRVSTEVTNTGTRAGDEVVQLYIHQRAGRASRPVRELKGFQRITLQPGERRSVSFDLDESSVRYWNGAVRNWVVDPGTFDVWVGASSTATSHATFTVGGQPRVVRGWR